MKKFKEKYGIDPGIIIILIIIIVLSVISVKNLKNQILNFSLIDLYNNLESDSQELLSQLNTAEVIPNTFVHQLKHGVNITTPSSWTLLTSNNFVNPDDKTASYYLTNLKVNTKKVDGEWEKGQTVAIDIYITENTFEIERLYAINELQNYGAISGNQAISFTENKYQINGRGAIRLTVNSDKEKVVKVREFLIIKLEDNLTFFLVTRVPTNIDQTPTSDELELTKVVDSVTFAD